MTTTTSHLTLTEVLQDLEAGRSLPSRTGEPLSSFRSLPRSTLGGRAFLRSHLTARVLGRIHPRLARRSLVALWLTPWVHPSALEPVDDVSGEFHTWSLRRDGTRLYGYVGGCGPTVVLVHGWAGRGADWRHLATDLVAAGWRVVVPDLPAHGMTTGRRTDVFELGRAVATVLHEERPAAVVTHSMGFPATMLALESGAPSPATLIALAPGRRIAHAVAGFARRAGLPPALLDQLRLGLEQRFGTDVWEVLDVDRVVPFLEADGLVVHDVDDDEVPLSDARRIAAAWPGAELVTTNGLGHRRIVREGIVRARIVQELS